jgi:hypothetical protein
LSCSWLWTPSDPLPTTSTSKSSPRKARTCLRMTATTVRGIRPNRPTIIGRRIASTSPPSAGRT